MAERVATSFRQSAIWLMIVLSLAIAAGLLFVDDGVLRFTIAAAGGFVLLRTWRVTRRKRDLSGRGFYVGRRVGNNWVYEELHDGEVLAIELPLAYAGRGEYEILIPGENSWPGRVPAWARERRAEIVERLGTVFKRSEMRSDD